MDVGAAGFEVVAVEDEVVGEAALPDGEIEGETVGVGALDAVHDVREGVGLWG